MSASRIRKSAGGMCLVSCLILVMLTTVLQVPVLAATVPPQPVLSSPAHGAAGVSTTPTLDWQAASGATSYQLWVSRNSDFTEATES